MTIAAIHGDGGRLTLDPRKNTASAAALALLQRLETTRGVTLTIHKGLPLASGIGSSGASAVAAVVATNELLGRPAPLDMLLECAMAGEQAGCGAIHPDNVSPSLYGGFILARSAQPPDIVRLPVPEGLACAVLHPQFEIETGAARKLLGDQVAAARCDAAMGERRRPGGGALHQRSGTVVAIARRYDRRAEARCRSSRDLPP